MAGFLIVAAFTLVFLMIATSVWLSGVWSAVITLVNVVLSALFATSFYNALAWAFAQRSPNVESSATAEFLAIWLLFVLAFVLLRIAAEFLTRHQLVLETWTDLIGRSLIAPVVSLIFCSFVLYTFHLSPLPIEGGWHNYFDRGDGGFGLNLDRGWGSYCRYASQGPLRETRFTASLLANVGRVYRSDSGELVDFGIGPFRQIAAGSRFAPKAIPPMDEYRKAMVQFRILVASHFQAHYEGFVKEQPDQSTGDALRQRDEANAQLERIAQDIRASVQNRAYGFFQ